MGFTKKGAKGLAAEFDAGIDYALSPSQVAALADYLVNITKYLYHIGDAVQARDMNTPKDKEVWLPAVVGAVSPHTTAAS